MAIFLVARVVDVTETAVPNAHATAHLGPMKATGTPGVFEILLPDGTTSAEVTVSCPPTFFDAQQKLTITPTSNPPTARFDGPQHINVRNVAVHTRGADFNVELDVVLGMLQDATAEVTAKASAFVTDLAPRARSVRRFGTPILNPAGSGKTLLHMSNASVSLPNGVLYARRTRMPKLLAIVNPFPIKKGSDAHQFRLHYNVFFHPTAHIRDEDPLANAYLRLVSRYVFKEWPNGKTLAYQNLADFAKNVLVFPAGGRDEQLHDIATQDAMLRLLLEINYWLQRMGGAPFPRMPLGGAGITGFSFGATYLADIMNSSRNARFHDKVLRMICALDGVKGAADGLEKSAPAWFRGGTGNRHLRIYTQFAHWLKFQSLAPSATVTKAVGGAVELEASGFSLLYAPESFWKEFDPSMDPGAIHQLFPSWFLEHAVTNSGFTPP